MKLKKTPLEQQLFEYYFNILKKRNVIPEYYINQYKKDLDKLKDEKARKDNKREPYTHLVEYQLQMIGKTIEDIKHNDEWFNQYTLTEEQFDDFRFYALKIIKKVLKCKDTMAIRNFDWFNLGYGLKVN